MTTNGSEYKYQYRVGDRIFGSYDAALGYAIKEYNMTSANTTIQVIPLRDY